MLTYRRKTQLFEYPIFNTESMTKSVPWENIAARICKTIDSLFRSGVNEALYGKQGKNFTVNEVVALCNLPLYDTQNEDALVTMDLNDVNSGLVISKVESDTAYDGVILREITIDKRYKISSPGYRIYTFIDSSDRFIVSIIHDFDTPKDDHDLVRLCGELSEVILQRELQLIGVPVSYNPPDYRVYTDSESTYHATGFIVFNDFPSIRDVLFEFNYLTVLISGMEEGYSVFNNKLLKNDQIIDFFSIDYRDQNTWCLDPDELKEFLEIDFKDDKVDMKYAIKKIHKLYHEMNNGE